MSKFKSIIKTLIATCLCTITQPVLAQNSDSLCYLSLDSCRAMALRTNFDLKIAEKTIEKAQAEKNALLSMYFPKISATGGAAYVFKDIQVLQSIDPLLPSFTIPSGNIPTELLGPINEGLNYLRESIVENWKPIEISMKGAFMAGITLQQPIFAGGRIITGNKMANIGVAMAEENKALKISETLVDADKSYWLYISVREKVKLAEMYDELLTQIETLLTNVKDVEMINRNDLMKVQVQHNQVKLMLQRARSGLQLSRMALCNTIGADYNTVIIPIDTVIQTVENFQLAPDSAVYNRSEYKLLRKMVEMKEGEVKLARGNYLPTIGLGASYAYAGGIRIQGQLDEPYNVSNIMATVSIPISHWWEGSQKIKSAKTDKKIAELEMQKNTRLMELEIKQATLNMVDAYTQIRMAEEALDQSKENLRISSDRYQVELETMANLLEAQAQWQTTYSNLIDARIEFRIKEIEFLKATGQLK